MTVSDVSRHKCQRCPETPHRLHQPNPCRVVRLLSDFVTSRNIRVLEGWRQVLSVCCIGLIGRTSANYRAANRWGEPLLDHRKADAGSGWTRVLDPGVRRIHRALPRQAAMNETRAASI
jgi:hypothetical protein